METEKFELVDSMAFLYLRDFVMSGFLNSDVVKQVSLAYTIAETVLAYKQSKTRVADVKIDDTPISEVNSVEQVLGKVPCIKCNGTNTKIIDTRALSGQTKRLFVCLDCHYQEELND